MAVSVDGSAVATWTCDDSNPTNTISQKHKVGSFARSVSRRRVRAREPCVCCESRIRWKCAWDAREDERATKRTCDTD